MKNCRNIPEEAIIVDGGSTPKSTPLGGGRLENLQPCIVLSK
jgi:hypothetical protein